MAKHRVTSACHARPVPAVSVMLLATVIVAGCNDGDVNTEPLPTPSAVASAVVGEAAMGLNASGRFAVLQSNAEDELNSGQAVTLANAYTKQFLPYENKFLEKQRGGSIDLKSLGSCGRPLYAASAFLKNFRMMSRCRSDARSVRIGS